MSEYYRFEELPIPYTPENVSYFMEMASEVKARLIRKHITLYHREIPQFMHIFEAPEPTKLWMRHVEEVDSTYYSVVDTVADETDELWTYSYIFEPEVVVPSSTIGMPRINRQIVNDSHETIRRDEVFSPISDEQFSRVYADIKWIYDGWHRT